MSALQKTGGCKLYCKIYYCKVIYLFDINLYNICILADVIKIIDKLNKKNKVVKFFLYMLFDKKNI